MNDTKLTYIFANVQGDYLDKLRALYEVASDINNIFAINCIVMSLTANPRLWSNGFVIALPTAESPPEIAEALENSLKYLTRWTIYQSVSSFLEYPQDGSLKESAWVLKDNPVSFFFFLAKAGEISFGSHIDTVIRSMKASTAYKIFSFTDGEILAVSTREPPKVTINRCYRSLQLFSHWVFCDPIGDSFRDDGKKDCWMEVSLLIDEVESKGDV
jgi:hypothetical protein